MSRSLLVSLILFIACGVVARAPRAAAETVRRRLRWWRWGGQGAFEPTAWLSLPLPGAPALG